MSLFFLLYLEYTLSNKRLKEMIINEFGDSVCFSYPRDRKKSQIFFSSSIHSEDLAETICNTDAIKQCASKLLDDCTAFNFELEGSFHSGEDVALSFEGYCKSRPPSWDTFFNVLLPQRSKSEGIKRKSDTIFQIIYYLIHDGQKKTPLHTSQSQCIHDISRSKTLIQVTNRLGFCISYDELERIDTSLALRTIELAGNNRVPVPEVVDGSAIIHGAIDNYDNEENTPSGIGGSHDTILMLFQNPKDTSNQHFEIGKVPSNFNTKRRSFENLLDCQKLLRQGKFSSRGEIPDDSMVW